MFIGDSEGFCTCVLVMFPRKPLIKATCRRKDLFELSVPEDSFHLSRAVWYEAGMEQQAENSHLKPQVQGTESKLGMVQITEPQSSSPVTYTT